MKWISLLMAICLQWSCSSVATAKKPYYGFIVKVSGNGLSAPSYIYGSNHLICASDIHGLESAWELLNKVQAIGFETDPSLNVSTKALYNKYWQSSPVPTLTELSTSEQMHFNILLDSYDSIQDWQAYKPIDIYLKIQSKTTPVCGIYQNINQWYWQKVQMENKIKANPLETVKHQMQWLHQSVDWPLLQSFLGQPLQQRYDFENRFLKVHWSQDNVLADSLFNKLYFGTLEEKRLLSIRNTQWISKMEQQFKQCSTLYVVGSLHLFGQNGLFNQLQQKGYGVEWVMP